MDNYLKHLIDKIKSEKEIVKDNNGQSLLKIMISNIGNDVECHLQILSEIYKISAEIVEYLKKIGKVTVHLLKDEIVIIY